MADVTTAYASPATASGTGWSASDAGTLVNALATSNDVWAQHAATVSDFLFAGNLSLAIPADRKVKQVDVAIEGGTGSLDIPGDVRTAGFFLTLDGSTPYGSEVLWDCTPGTTDLSGTISFTGLKLTPAQVNAATFGILVKRGTTTTGTEVPRRFDRLQIRAVHTEANVGGGQNNIRPPKEWHLMDHASAAKRGYTVLFFEDSEGNPTNNRAEEAMPSVTASNDIFANAPKGTRVIMLTLRTAGITMRFDGGAATASANGQDFSADPGQPYVFYATQSDARKMNAIAQSGTPTGWISYLGLAG